MGAHRASISRTIEILGSACFAFSTLSSISFQANSELEGTETRAFLSSSLQTSEIPRSVEILCSSSIWRCESLSSISLESNSRLKRIESSTFSFSSL
jgi:hypothetical protein